MRATVRVSDRISEMCYFDVGPEELGEIMDKNAGKRISIIGGEWGRYSKDTEERKKMEAMLKMRG